MKKDFIVSKIEASQDGSPYVYVAFHDANIDSKTTTTSGGGKNFPQSPFGSSNNSSSDDGSGNSGNSGDAIPPFFTSPEDLMKNLPKAMSNIFGGGGGSIGMSGDFPTFKISMREYEDIQLKVGDKVTIDIKKADSSSGI